MAAVASVVGIVMEELAGTAATAAASVVEIAPAVVEDLIEAASASIVRIAPAVVVKKLALWQLVLWNWGLRQWLWWWNWLLVVGC